MIYYYRWLHMLTGNSGTGNVSEEHMRKQGCNTIYELMNKWNLSQTWKYWFDIGEQSQLASMQ